MTITLTDTDLTDLTFELSDGELFNDVLIIVGEAGAEKLVRGYDEASIAKYGRRSKRIDRPIVANADNDETEAVAQATAMLDRYREPVPCLHITIISRDEALTEAMLGMEISIKLIIYSALLGINQTFIVEGIDLDVNASGVLTGSYDLVQAREGE